MGPKYRTRNKSSKVCNKYCNRNSKYIRVNLFRNCTRYMLQLRCRGRQQIVRHSRIRRRHFYTEYRMGKTHKSSYFILKNFKKFKLIVIYETQVSNDVSQWTRILMKRKNFENKCKHQLINVLVEKYFAFVQKNVCVLRFFFCLLQCRQSNIQYSIFNHNSFTQSE